MKLFYDEINPFLVHIFIHKFHSEIKLIFV